MNATALQTIPELASLAREADVIDIKTVEGQVTLREFIASMMGYYPEWIKALYRIRAVFVRLLGMRQEGIPRDVRLRPQDVPMTPGAHVSFFSVAAACEDALWLVGVNDKHLSAWLGVVVEDLPGAPHRFHVITLVKYHHWTGPVYFNVIRPFHHLVVRQMARAGVQPLVHAAA
jgi:hypothetical protein